METTRTQLGFLFREHRQHLELSQEQVAERSGASTNRSAVAHLEQGIRLPKPDALEAIAAVVGVPRAVWSPFADGASLQRLEFEELLGELTGERIELAEPSEAGRASAEFLVSSLLGKSLSPSQTYDTLNSVLTHYGVLPVAWEFFRRYFDPSSFSTLKAFGEAIQGYQKDAIRLFSTLGEAFRTLNQAKNIEGILRPLNVLDADAYFQRTPWSCIDQIEDERLPDLGYISAARVKQEEQERQALRTFLEQLAASANPSLSAALEAVPEKTRRRMDSLLRKFNTSFAHGLFSPLFKPDPDALSREAQRLAPKSDTEIERMANTQGRALQNLAYYLSADHMDVYVATSMRSDADFVSVNHFVGSLFSHEQIESLKLRYFNPTQSWIDDRIAKGLVEALMLRRASATIYMAQKADTFGKDSEASVALGQGKPVIVYVPKLTAPSFDTEQLLKCTRAELLERLKAVDESQAADVDESIDDEALAARIVGALLEPLTDESLAGVVSAHWADFDLYGEAERIDDNDLRSEYRAFLDSTTSKGEGQAVATPSPQLRAHLMRILVATSMRFERRARVFREIHPLALQVILSSGVLNGILVVRSVDECAEVLGALIRNKLELELTKDADNYRLVERRTGSTIRVISRHVLLRNAFDAHYEQERRRAEAAGSNRAF